MKEKGCHNFTPSEREATRQIILEGMLKFHSTEQVLQNVENRVKISIAPKTILNMKYQIKKDRNQELQIMMKDNVSFRDKYMQDIDDINLLIKSQWELFHLTNDFGIKKECLNAIAHYVIIRHKLYDFLPSLCAMSPFQDAIEVMQLKNRTKDFGI
jgi:hypothetical protein